MKKQLLNQLIKDLEPIFQKKIERLTTPPTNSHYPLSESYISELREKLSKDLVLNLKAIYSEEVKGFRSDVAWLKSIKPTKKEKKEFNDNHPEIDSDSFLFWVKRAAISETFHHYESIAYYFNNAFDYIAAKKDYEIGVIRTKSKPWDKRIYDRTIFETAIDIYKHNDLKLSYRQSLRAAVTQLWKENPKMIQKEFLEDGSDQFEKLNIAFDNHRRPRKK